MCSSKAGLSLKLDRLHSFIRIYTTWQLVQRFKTGFWDSLNKRTTFDCHCLLIQKLLGLSWDLYWFSKIWNLFTSLKAPPAAQSSQSPSRTATLASRTAASLKEVNSSAAKWPSSPARPPTALPAKYSGSLGVSRYPFREDARSLMPAHRSQPGGAPSRPGRCWSTTWRSSWTLDTRR